MEENKGLELSGKKIEEEQMGEIVGGEDLMDLVAPLQKGPKYHTYQNEVRKKE